jgi:hypothetical protein
MKCVLHRLADDQPSVDADYVISGVSVCAGHVEDVYYAAGSETFEELVHRLAREHAIRERDQRRGVGEFGRGARS